MSTEEVVTKDDAVPSTLLSSQTDTVPILTEDDLAEVTVNILTADRPHTYWAKYLPTGLHISVN